jgi:hypothetical protein
MCTMKTYWGAGGGIVPLNPNIGTRWMCEESISRPSRFIRRERILGLHWIGGWVGPRERLNVCRGEKSVVSAVKRTLDHPGCSLATMAY